MKFKWLPFHMTYLPHHMTVRVVYTEWSCIQIRLDASVGFGFVDRHGRSLLEQDVYMYFVSAASHTKKCLLSKDGREGWLTNGFTSRQ